MIEDERAQDVYDVSREVDQNREQGAELNDGDRRGGLFRLQCLVSAAVKLHEACGKNEMCGGTNRDEFRQALNEAEEDGLKDCHYGFYSRKEFRSAIQSYIAGGISMLARTMVASCQGKA